MRSTRLGFSLLEVVIAIGIFATGIVVVLGLMGTMAGRSTEATESVTALNMPSLIESALREQADNDFAAIQSFVANESTLVANHAGDRIRVRPADADADDDSFFLIKLNELKSDEFTAVHDVVETIAVTVSWPYKPFGATTITPPKDRSSVSFNLAISR